MSIIKNIKSLFIIEEETTAKETAASEKTVKKSAAVKPVETVTTTQQDLPESKAGSPGKAEKKFTDILFKAMQKSNIEGFDYLEYKQSLLSLKKMNMDEATRYKSAYAMAETMGVNPQRLVDTAQHYVKVLQQEEEQFEKAMQGRLEKSVHNKKQQMQKLEDGMQHKQEQIRKLQADIEAGQAKLKKMKHEVEEDLQNMESVKNNFIASYNVIAGQIQQDIENMQKYLK